MKARPEPTFPTRSSFRQRRLADAARVLPFVGAFLFLLPVLWGREAPLGTSWGGIYVFAAWALLILAAGALSHLMSRRTGDADDGDDGDG